MICKRCGASLPAGSRVCGACGASLAPSREEIRARVQGARPGPAAARTPLPAVNDAVLSLVGVALSLVLILLLFIHGAVTAPNAFTNEKMSFSLFDGSTILCALFLLFALGCGVCELLPLLGNENPLTRKAALPLAVLELILGIAAVVEDVKGHTVVDTVFGTGAELSKASLGFAGVLFLILCVAALVVALLFALGGGAAPAPARRAAPVRKPASAAPSRAQTRSSAARRTSAPHPGSIRTGSAARPQARGVTPPDAETIAALRRMAQMHKEGLVSDAEFARIKAECVARGWIRE